MSIYNHINPSHGQHGYNMTRLKWAPPDCCDATKTITRHFCTSFLFHCLDINISSTLWRLGSALRSSGKPRKQFCWTQFPKNTFWRLLLFWVGHFACKTFFSKSIILRHQTTWKTYLSLETLLWPCWNADMLTCWQADMLTWWHAYMLTCWYAVMLTTWHVGMLICWHADILTCWHTYVLTCLLTDMLTCWHADNLTCWHAEMLTI